MEIIVLVALIVALTAILVGWVVLGVDDKRHSMNVKPVVWDMRAEVEYVDSAYPRPKSLSSMS